MRARSRLPRLRESRRAPAGIQTGAKSVRARYVSTCASGAKATVSWAQRRPEERLDRRMVHLRITRIGTRSIASFRHPFGFATDACASGEREFLWRAVAKCPVRPALVAVKRSHTYRYRGVPRLHIPDRVSAPQGPHHLLNTTRYGLLSSSYRPAANALAFGVLSIKLHEPACLARLRPAVDVLPTITSLTCLLRHSGLAIPVCLRRSSHSFLQHRHDLLDRKALVLHDKTLLCVMVTPVEQLTFSSDPFVASRSLLEQLYAKCT